ARPLLPGRGLPPGLHRAQSEQSVRGVQRPPQAPAARQAVPRPRPQALTMDPRLQHGIDLFNRREFFVCHEVLEEIWTPERGPRRLFLQSLIHFAVAFYHDQRGNPVGASRQLRKGLRKLAAYLPACEGIDTASLIREGLRAVERTEAGARLGEYPEIRLAHTVSAV